MCLLSTSAVFALWRTGFAPLHQAETYFEDLRSQLGRKTIANPGLVFIGITQGNYADVPLEQDAEAQQSINLRLLRGNFPWPRSVWADLIDQLMGAGAQAVAIDLLFLAPGNDDDALRATLERHRGRVVIGSNFSGGSKNEGNALSLALPAESLIHPGTNTSAAFDERVGYVNFWPQDDDTVRTVRYRLADARLWQLPPTAEGPFHESLAARLLRATGQPEVIPLDDTPRRFRLGNPKGREFRPVPLNEIFSPKLWLANFRNGDFFRDKIVIVGPAANFMHDEHGTALGPILGPALHLHALNAALHGEFLRETTLNEDSVAIVSSGLVLAILCAAVRLPVRRMGIILALTSVGIFVSQWSYDHWNIFLPTLSPLLVLNLGGLSTLAYEFVVERIERLKLRSTIGYYFSPRVLEEVLANPGSMQPKEAQVTLLLTDLRNSTPLAEVLKAQGMFQLLNDVFEVETAAVMAEEGNLEHFLGDQFLSYWGAPQAQPDAADRALRAAHKLIEAMETLRSKMSPEVNQLFGYGVALHSGPVLFGNKGSAQRLDYGLVGDTVNEAARVEALTKYYGVKLIITGETHRQLTKPGTSRLLDRVIVKGKSVPVELREVENACSAPNFSALASGYEAAFTHYTGGRFKEAQAAFEQIGNKLGDPPSLRMAERCQYLQENPSPDWTGVWRMENK